MSDFLNHHLHNHKLYGLLRRVTEGDETAFDMLYEEYKDFVYFHIMTVTNDPEIGKDILQETYVKLSELPPKNLPRFGATSWLIKVAKNTAYSYLKRLKPAGSLDEFVDEGFEFAAHTKTHTSMENEIVSKMYVESVLSVFDRLTRRILQLRYEGYTFDEIGVKLNINPATVRSRFFRAIKKLNLIVGDLDEAK